MKKLLKKWAIWFFKKQINVYQYRKSVETMAFTQTNTESLVDRIKFDLVRGITEQMYKDGLIEIEEREDWITNCRIFTAKIRVI